MNQVVFHTDVTKVLSADSYVVSRFSPDLPTPPPADPYALNDFLDIVDVVTNETFVQYRPAANQTGLLSRACEHISLATEPIRPPVSPPIRDLDDVTKDAEQCLPSFAPLTQAETSVRRLAEWFRFQVSTSYLQTLFWGANDEQELRYALEVYRRYYTADDDLITKAVSLLGRHPLGYASDALNQASWSAPDFFLAYSFWAYIKGCRFARGLAKDEIYVVHWLRKSAIAEAEGAKKGSQETLGVRIPWGSVVRHQLDPLRVDAEVQSLTDTLIALRRYSIKESKHAVTPRLRRDFLATGLMAFNDTMGLTKGLGVDTFAEKAGDVAGSTDPLVGQALKFIAQLVSRPITKARAVKTIKYLASTDSRVAAFIENDV